MNDSCSKGNGNNQGIDTPAPMRVPGAPVNAAGRAGRCPAPGLGTLLVVTSWIAWPAAVVPPRTWSDEPIRVEDQRNLPAELAEDHRALFADIRNLMETRGIHRHETLGLEYYSSYFGDLYDWELYFDSVLLAYYGGDEFAVQGLRVFLKNQRPDGFIPRRIPKHPLPDDAPPLAKRIYAEEKQEHCKPFLCQIALLVSRARGSTDWIQPDDYRALQAYLGHWCERWDRDRNGLCEWSSAPHSGADTQLNRVGPWGSRYCEGTDLNSFLYREYLAAGYLAQALGHLDDARQSFSRAERTARAVRELLWNDAEGLFYDRDARGGATIRVKSAATFLPMAVGIATPQQAQALVSRHLNNPQEFATPFPLPSYARSEPGYTQRFEPEPGVDPLYALGSNHANWCGGMWPHWNILISHGLRDYGFAKESHVLADRLLKALSAEAGFFEWYNAETGAGCGLNPFWAGATVLGAMLPVELARGFQPLVPRPCDEPLDFRSVRQVLGIAQDFQPSPAPR